MEMVKKKNVGMTEGNPIKIIILFTLPLLLGNVFQQFYNIIDSVIVGRFVGDSALAAVSSSGSLINLLIGLIQGISVGAGIVIAQYYGARNIEKLRKSMHTATLFSMILGIFMTIVGIIITPMLLRLMNTPEEVLPQSIAYFRTYFGGVFFTILYNMGSSIFRSIGDSKHPLYFLIISCFINVILDLLFVAVFKWGVIGVGIATIIAQAVSTVVTYGLLIKTKEEYNFSFK